MKPKVMLSPRARYARPGTQLAPPRSAVRERTRKKANRIRGLCMLASCWNQMVRWTSPWVITGTKIDPLAQKGRQADFLVDIGVNEVGEDLNLRSPGPNRQFPQQRNLIGFGHKRRHHNCDIVNNCLTRTSSHYSTNYWLRF